MKRMKWISLLLVLGGVCALLASAPAGRAAQGPGSGTGAPSAPREYQIKVGFLFNFIKYVTWPGDKTNVTIGVLGKNPFGSALDTLNGKVANGKTLSVRHVSTLQEARGVDVLFISASETPRLRQILDSLKGQPVLTTGEAGGFCQSGGIINFTSEGNKVRFEINPEAAERADLKISSQLLRLAKVVRG